MNYPARTRRDNPPTRKRGFIENLRVIFQMVLKMMSSFTKNVNKCCPIFPFYSETKAKLRKSIKKHCFIIRIYSEKKRKYLDRIRKRFWIIDCLLKMKEKCIPIYELFENFLALIVSFPIAILEACGIPVIAQLFSWCPVCTLCTFGAIIGVSSSVAVAVGVGLGVGLNCAETQYYPIQNVTNTTNINSAANINSTININSTTNSTG